MLLFFRRLHYFLKLFRQRPSPSFCFTHSTYTFQATINRRDEFVRKSGGHEFPEEEAPKEKSDERLDTFTVRLGDLHLDATQVTTFIQTLNSLSGQLEQLDTIRLGFPRKERVTKINCNLNLPALNTVQLSQVSEIKQLTLDAPRLTLSV